MLIDVRTKEEYTEAHHDTAINIPLNELETHALTVPLNEPIVIHCRSGARAQAGLDILKKRGFTNLSLRNDTGAY